MYHSVGWLRELSFEVLCFPCKIGEFVFFLDSHSISSVQFSSVPQSCPSLCDPMDCSMPGLLPCQSPTPRAYSNSCPSSQWCHPTISSSVIPFSSCLQSFPASWAFPTSQFFASGGQSIGASASASVLPMNIQDWFPLGWTGWISLQSKRLSRVFSSSSHWQTPIHPSVSKPN